ncbi:MAG: T9SS type A sorting domain-containing protein [Chitinophagaceae bacterium]|nr:T9SS type A sorting domain-containing protein [Chitinophagaceae bacterium]
MVWPDHFLSSSQFDAKKINSSSAKVSWQVSNSSNAAQFEVLRSSDARNFVPVGSVTATDRVYTYGFDDNSLPFGTSYYRLRMTDQQGIVTLSAVVAVLNGNKDVILTSMVPTAVTSGAYLNISSSVKGTMLLQITDMYGRIVTQQQAAIATGNQQVPLTLQQLPAGAYQVTAIMNNNRIGTIRFVKQ